MTTNPIPYSLATYTPVVSAATPRTFLASAREFLDEFSYLGERQIVQISPELGVSMPHPHPADGRVLKIATYAALAYFVPFALGLLVTASCVSRRRYSFEVVPLEQLPLDLLQRALELQPKRVEFLLARWVLEGNQQGELRLEAQERISFFLRGNQNRLDLSGLGLSTLPDVFHHPTFQKRLNYLYLYDNRLTALPESLGNLAALQSLFIHRNRLSTLPESLGNLPRLESLDLSSNLLTSIPNSLGNCTALNKLSLSFNQLTAIPESLGNCTALTELTLYDNQLTAIPDSLGNCTALTSLYLSKNLLTAIPESLGNCTALTSLRLFNNRLTAIPDSVGNLAALGILDFSGNRLTGLPNALLYGSLTSNCTIEVAGNSLSDHVREALRTALSAPDYHGPRVSYSMSTGAPRIEARPMDALLGELYTTAGQGARKEALNAELAPLFALPEPQQTNLTTWLSRLSDTADYRAGGVVQRKLAQHVLSYLVHASKDREFREGIFATGLAGASTTCGDRVALSILDLGVAVKRLEIKESKDPQAVARFLMGTHAVELLKKIAQVKVLQMPFVDEIEVYLIYPVKLKSRLNLPIDIDEMLYPACANVNEAALEEAARSVEAEIGDPTKQAQYLIEQKEWIQLLETHALSRDRYQEIVEIRDKRSEDATKPAEYAYIGAQFKEDLVGLSLRLLAATS